MSSCAAWVCGACVAMHAPIRQAEMQAKSLAYRERVERIKATRLAETIKAQRISER